MEEYRLHHGTHGTPEEFDLYAMGRLSAGRSGELEEHLLVCEGCRLQLDEAASYCLTMRQELLKPEAPGFRLDWSWLRMPAVAMAAMAMLLLVFAGWFLYRPRTPLIPLATIQLSALRGEMPVAAEARETDVTLLDAGTQLGSAEVVDANGGSVWKGPLAEGGKLRLSRALARGTYFVRLYDGPRLIREYGFQVR